MDRWQAGINWLFSLFFRRFSSGFWFPWLLRSARLLGCLFKFLSMIDVLCIYVQNVWRLKGASGVGIWCFSPLQLLHTARIMMQLWNFLDVLTISCSKSHSGLQDWLEIESSRPRWRTDWSKPWHSYSIWPIRFWRSIFNSSCFYDFLLQLFIVEFAISQYRFPGSCWNQHLLQGELIKSIKFRRVLDTMIIKQKCHARDSEVFKYLSYRCENFKLEIFPLERHYLWCFLHRRGSQPNWICIDGLFQFSCSLDFSSVLWSMNEFTFDDFEAFPLAFWSGPGLFQRDAGRPCFADLRAEVDVFLSDLWWFSFDVDDASSTFSMTRLCSCSLRRVSLASMTLSSSVNTILWIVCNQCWLWDEVRQRSWGTVSIFVVVLVCQYRCIIWTDLGARTIVRVYEGVLVLILRLIIAFYSQRDARMLQCWASCRLALPRAHYPRSSRIRIVLVMEVLAHEIWWICRSLVGITGLAILREHEVLVLKSVRWLIHVLLAALLASIILCISPSCVPGSQLLGRYHMSMFLCLEADLFLCLELIIVALGLYCLQSLARLELLHIRLVAFLFSIWSIWCVASESQRASDAVGCRVLPTPCYRWLILTLMLILTRSISSNLSRAEPSEPSMSTLHWAPLWAMSIKHLRIWSTVCVSMIFSLLLRTMNLREWLFFFIAVVVKLFWLLCLPLELVWHSRSCTNLLLVSTKIILIRCDNRSSKRLLFHFASIDIQRIVL